jgi:hypothetical protein
MGRNLDLTPSPVYRAPNGATLTAVEHAVVEARRWQHDNLQLAGTRTYEVVAFLLNCWSTADLERIYRKAGIR